jgi:DinB family protein
MTLVRAELDELLRGASDAALRRPEIEGQWSCADILAHFAGYTRGVADGLAKARGAAANSPPYDAPPGLGDDEFNAIVVNYWRSRPSLELLKEERDAFRALVAEVDMLPADALDKEGKFAFLGGRSLAAILPGNGHRHYREHFPAIMRGLRRTS